METALWRLISFPWQVLLIVVSFWWPFTCLACLLYKPAKNQNFKTPYFDSKVAPQYQCRQLSEFCFKLLFLTILMPGIMWLHKTVKFHQAKNKRVSNHHGFRGQIEDIRLRRRKKQKANVKTTNVVLDIFFLNLIIFKPVSISEGLIHVFKGLWFSILQSWNAKMALWMLAGLS